MTCKELRFKKTKAIAFSIANALIFVGLFLQLNKKFLGIVLFYLGIVLNLLFLSWNEKTKKFEKRLFLKCGIPILFFLIISVIVAIGLYFYKKIEVNESLNMINLHWFLLLFILIVSYTFLIPKNKEYKKRVTLNIVSAILILVGFNHASIDKTNRFGLPISMLGFVILTASMAMC